MEVVFPGGEKWEESQIGTRDNNKSNIENGYYQCQVTTVQLTPPLQDMNDTSYRKYSPVGTADVAN